jgi:AcrR family transcriptional regulator
VVLKRPRGEALRRRVLETALRLFSERGYFNTSIHDIRREAGVSIGAIYHHFGNKENLAQALYDDLMARMEAAIVPVIHEHQGCRERSRSIIALLFELTTREPRMMEFVLMAKHREFLPNEAPICSSRPFLAMRQVLVDGMADGGVRRMDPWVAATAMFGGALRMMNLQLDRALDRPLTDYLDQVVDCGWRAVRV